MLPSHALPPPQTPPARPSLRSEQPVGAHFATPRKKRAPWKDTAVVVRSDALLRRQELESQLQVLLREDEDDTGNDGMDGQSDEGTGMRVDDVSEPMLVDPDEFASSEPQPAQNVDDTTTPPARRPRRLVPDESSQRLYSSWLLLIPSLASDFLHYIRAAHGRTKSVEPQLAVPCRLGCKVELATVQCLYYHCMSSLRGPAFATISLTASSPYNPRSSLLQMPVPAQRARSEWTVSYVSVKPSCGRVDRSPRLLLRTLRTFCRCDNCACGCIEDLV